MENNNKKYSNGVIYWGNLLKNVDGEIILFKEKVLLVYDESKDLFYSFLDTFNLFSSIDLNKLSVKVKQEYQREIDKYAYNYTYSGNKEEIYVDLFSIVPAFGMDNKSNLIKHGK